MSRAAKRTSAGRMRPAGRGLRTPGLGYQFEALAVLASSAYSGAFKKGKLLGIQTLESATGKAQADASFELLELWNLTKSVRALVFDTTSSNTGKNKGAVPLLEELINRKVFYNACRHHIYELVIREVWKCLFGSTTTGPENTDFNTFKKKWKHIDKSRSYKTLKFIEGSWLAMKADEAKQEIIPLMKPNDGKQKEVLIRDDYRECATGTLAILDDKYVDHRFRKPGATHSARWMSQVLYCQKMFMWSEQMDYSEEFIEKLERINTFIALFYVPAWLKTGIACDAPWNDLKFLHDMKNFSLCDLTVADVAYKKLRKHHWYLTEEKVVFTTFSANPTIPDKLKEAMAAKLLKMPIPEKYRRCMPLSLISDSVSESMSMVDLIGPESWFLFDAIHVEHDWLSLPVSEWHADPDFVTAQEFVNTVEVVNDAAERMVKLNTDYAAFITDDKKQRASLLQAVEDHRNRYADFSKATISST